MAGAPFGVNALNPLGAAFGAGGGMGMGMGGMGGMGMGGGMGGAGAGGNTRPGDWMCVFVFQTLSLTGEVQHV